jgi:beta-xylosidase
MMMSLLIFACCTLVTADDAALKEYATRDIHIRDPYIVPIPDQGRYYMYGTNCTLPGGTGFDTFWSTDLKTWKGPVPVFRPDADFWGKTNFWAPEVHRYNGKYYMFASFKAEGVNRATQILVADGPEGPFKVHSPEPVTPPDRECLDGTLFIDKDAQPWIVFCHEWTQIEDGTICAQKLTPALDASIGEPVLLFKATDAPWVKRIGFGGPRTGYVTDGPFLHTTKGGRLAMLWSSFGQREYTLSAVWSETDKITGPWKQQAEPIYTNDGGHGMFFRTFEGKLMLSLHQPNGGKKERPHFFSVEEKDNGFNLTEYAK